ncbi:FecR family protein [Terasakiella sp.]|uniref:FecR family protein n=1 Tax=Terasakiella sp. TaxID=2034861 RepID=UPI003AA809D8
MKNSPLLLAFLFSFVCASIGWANEPVGTTLRASGATSVLRLENVFSQRKDDPVFWQDTIKTGAASRMEIRFIDNTMLYVGDHSSLQIDELVYQPNKPGKAFFTLSQGVFRMVSGALNKMDGSTFTLRTPLATIGIRGTDFWGHQTADKLTMALLDDGELRITSGKETIVLTNPLEAVVIEKGKNTVDVFTLTPEQVAQAKKTIE